MGCLDSASNSLRSKALSSKLSEAVLKLAWLSTEKKFYTEFVVPPLKEPVLSSPASSFLLYAHADLQ